MNSFDETHAGNRQFPYALLNVSSYKFKSTKRVMR